MNRYLTEELPKPGQASPNLVWQDQDKI